MRPPPRDPAGPAHARGVHDTEPLPVPVHHLVDGVAGRARGRADQHAVHAQQPVDQRRLPDVGAADHHDAGFRAGTGLGGVGRRRRRRRQPGGDLVQKLPNPLSVLGRNLDHRLETEPMELRHARARPPVVDLVDGQHHRNPARPKLAGELVVGRHRSLAAVHHEDHHVRFARGAPSAIRHRRLHRIGARAGHAAGVDEGECPPLPLDRPREDVAGGAGHLGDDGAPRPRQTVEECRLAHVRPAHQGGLSRGAVMLMTHRGLVPTLAPRRLDSRK